MKLTFKNSLHEIWDNDDSSIRVAINEDCTMGGKKYYSVVVKHRGQKGITLATRCTYQKALELVESNCKMEEQS